MLRRRLWTWVALSTAAALALAWALRPAAEPVEVVRPFRAALEVTLEQEGRTHMADRFSVSAPASGNARRITLRAGDDVAAGTVLAEIEPAASTALDPRAAAEARAALERARAGLQAAIAEREAAAAEAARATQRSARLREATVGVDDEHLRLAVGVEYRRRGHLQHVRRARLDEAHEDAVVVAERRVGGRWLGEVQDHPHALFLDAQRRDLGEGLGFDAADARRQRAIAAPVFDAGLAASREPQRVGREHVGTDLEGRPAAEFEQGLASSDHALALVQHGQHAGRDRCAHGDRALPASAAGAYRHACLGGCHLGPRQVRGKARGAGPGRRGTVCGHRRIDFVARHGAAADRLAKRSFTAGRRGGATVEVIAGLGTDDRVVLNPRRDFKAGLRVQPTPAT